MSRIVRPFNIKTIKKISAGLVRQKKNGILFVNILKNALLKVEYSYLFLRI